jgi:cation diffusion facilitator family transporter
MLNNILDWFGFGSPQAKAAHDHGGAHGHTHGVMDATIATTTRGIWAIKWSFVILAVTATAQILVVLMSGSVALLADAIHNVGDAGTAIPLWVAFLLARRKPNKTFPYGYGRVEDIAGVLIVAIILFSAVFAGYEAIYRLLHPQSIVALGWVVLAGLAGFAGNEVVAVLRIRVGREIDSAALIADGYHARADGLTSLAVVLGAFGVWLGFPLADPIVGLLITVAIFGIVWQSAKSVFTRMLDGLEPGTLDEVYHAAEHVKGVLKVTEARARWMGHRLHVDVVIALAPGIALAEANTIAAALEAELADHLPALAEASIRFDRGDAVVPHAGHSHAPDPFRFDDPLAAGVLTIIDTDAGERFQLTLSRGTNLQAVVRIDRGAGGTETLVLSAIAGQPATYLSAKAPEEPHEFNARLDLRQGEARVELPFRMVEPEHHH